MKIFSTKRKAFTLIELLIVIAIIGILFIVLVSKVDFATDKAKATGVQTDFRSFQMAFDTVAKENAGFNTFGWDTGDANQDGIRNSYDEGDNGAGGGIAKNGVQDGTEVFTGHKVYAETFTKVYSLKKNGTGNYDRDAFNRLETAINANLDPKLHITIKDDGEIVMANGAQDPWNKEYHGYYITNAENDKKDRGAIVMYSDGANNEFGSEHTIANGIVSISIPNNNKYGKDDYGMAVIYTYVNGYGEIKNITTGFSNNQSFLAGGNVNSDGSGDNVITPQEPDVTELLDPGLYETGSNYTVKLKTWDELLQNNNFVVKDGVLKTGIMSPSDIVLPELNEYGFYYDVKYFHPFQEYGQTCYNEDYLIFHADGTFDYYLYDMEIGGVHLSGQGRAIYETGIINYSSSEHTIGDFGCFMLTDDGLALRGTNGYLQYLIGSETKFVESGDIVLPADGSITSIESIGWSDGNLTGIVIPKTVTELGEAAFGGCNCTNITIPDSVVTIGNYAFSSCKFTTVVIPDSVTSIGSGAFRYCDNLTSVTIGNNVKSIGGAAFYDCTSLTSISIPDSVTTLGNGVFEECSALTDITLGSNIIDIGHRAFAWTGYYNNPDVWERNVLYIDKYAVASDMQAGVIYFKEGTEVIGGMALDMVYAHKYVIPSSVNYIHKTAFGPNDSLLEVHINKPEGSIPDAPWSADETLGPTTCTIYWNSAPEIPPEELEFSLNADGQSYSVSGIGEYGKTDVIIPDTYKGLPVTAIGPHVFSGANIKSVIIPNTITSIGDGAFGGCRLTTVELSANVVNLSPSAFSGQFLTDIIIADNNPVYKSIDGVVYTKDGKTIVCYPNGREDNVFAIPTGVTTIGKEALSGCGNLDTIIIPNTVINIDEGAFAYTPLGSIVIPNSVRTIGDKAFEGCQSFRSSTITIPEGVISIGKQAFAACLFVEKVIIPNSVNSIGEEAFTDCEILSDIYINAPENSISGAPWRGFYDWMKPTVHWNSTGPET